MSKPRYQAIHDLAESAVDAVRKELGRLEMKRAEISVALADGEASLIEAGAHANPAFRHQYGVYWTARQADLARLRAGLAQVDAEIEQTREALRESHRRLAAINELQTRDREAIAKRDQRREAKAMDEFATVRRALDPATHAGSAGSAA
jgi:flagellar export protein FliJ